MNAMRMAGTHRAVLLTIVFAGIVPAGPAHGEGVKLTPRYESGRARYVETRDNVEQIINAGSEGGMTIRQSMIFGMQERVESASPEKTVLSFTFQRVMMAGNSPSGEVNYDSDRSEQSTDVDEDVAPIFAPMIGQVVRLELGSDRRPVAASGFKELVQRVEKEVGSNMLFDQIKPSLSNEVHITQWAVRMQFVTDKEVRPGDSWKSTVATKLPFLGDMNYDFENKLKSVEKRDGGAVAVVEYSGKGKPGTDGPTDTSFGPMRLLSSTITGTVEFDVDRGEILREDNASEMVIRMGPAASQPTDDGGIRVLVKRKGLVEAMSDAQRTAQKAANARGKSGSGPASQPAGSSSAPARAKP